jgi:5'-3' exonuclease
MRLHRASPPQAFYQLLGPGLELLRVGSRGGGPTRVTAADICAATGLQQPSHWADYVALAGDAHRRIPGVKGIGKASAAALVGAQGTVEDILADLDAAPVGVGGREGWGG